MKLLLIFITFLLVSCNIPKTVLICGDHICINKKEAEQYFEENLSIELKIIDKKVNEEIDLVELNLNQDETGQRVVGIFSKKKQNKNLKTLSDKEVSKIKKKIKNKKKNKNKLNNKKKIKKK